MKYVHIRWDNKSLDEPVSIFSEVDSEDWEVRRVEVFRDDHLAFASERSCTPGCGLAELKFGDLDEINENPEFHAEIIAEERFNEMWKKATKIN